MRERSRPLGVPGGGLAHQLGQASLKRACARGSASGWIGRASLEHMRRMLRRFVAGALVARRRAAGKGAGDHRVAAAAAPAPHLTRKQEQGHRRVDAAVEAAGTRLRPILMTPFASILGVVALA